MMIRRIWAVVLVALASGCSPDGVSPGDTYLAATLAGAVQGEYRGSGTFGAGTLPDGRPTTQIFSRGEGANADEMFAVRNYGGGRLPVGTYPLKVITGITSGAAGVSALYFRQGDGEEHFVSDGGELTITYSTGGRVEGSFRLLGFRYCLIDEENPVGCTIPSAAPAGAPRITVTGSFVAAPADNRRIPSDP